MHRYGKNKLCSFLIYRCERIIEEINEHSLEQFETNDTLSSALYLNVILVGQIIKDMPKRFKEKHSDNIEWDNYILMGLKVQLEFENITIGPIYDMCVNDIPILKEKIEEISKSFIFFRKVTQSEERRMI